MNKLAKKQQLCEAVNMNFDEANELFSSETLENMQMAKINGGEPISTATAIGLTLAAFSLAVAAVALYHQIYGTTPNPTPLIINYGTINITVEGSAAEVARDTLGLSDSTSSYTVPGSTDAPTDVP